MRLTEPQIGDEARSRNSGPAIAIPIVAAEGLVAVALYGAHSTGSDIIDGDGPLVPLALPLRSLAKRALHDVARQAVDEARPLGDRPQRFRCEQPVRRVLPAEHRLDTGHRSRRQLDLRLVEEGELALLERPP